MTTPPSWWAHPGPPPDPPELPEDAARWPRWPAWYAPVGFVAGFAATFLIFLFVAILAGIDPEDDGPTVTIVGTFIQDLALIGTAVLFASWTARPRAWHFGLRRAPFWRTVGWATLGMVSFYFFAVAYGLVVQPDAEQTVVEDLGADESTFSLILAGFVVIVMAPIGEEFFFRGFFYRALRTRLGIAAAALVDGAVFGLIHYTGSDTLEILPILGALGVIFCLVYERTGTLYAPMALHAFNNTIAYSAALDDEPASVAVSAALGVTFIAACMIVPRFTSRRAPPVR